MEVIGEWVINRLDLRIGQQRRVAIVPGMPESFFGGGFACGIARGDGRHLTLARSTPGITLLAPIKAVLMIPTFTADEVKRMGLLLFGRTNTGQELQRLFVRRQLGLRAGRTGAGLAPGICEIGSTIDPGPGFYVAILTPHRRPSVMSGWNRRTAIRLAIDCAARDTKTD